MRGPRPETLFCTGEPAPGGEGVPACAASIQLSSLSPGEEAPLSPSQMRPAFFP